MTQNIHFKAQHLAGYLVYYAINLTHAEFGLQNINVSQGSCFVVIKGLLDQSNLPKIQSHLASILTNSTKIAANNLSKKAAAKLGFGTNSTSSKIVFIDETPIAVADKNLYSKNVLNLDQISKLTITDIAYDNGHSLVHYKLTQAIPTTDSKPTSASHSHQPTSTPLSPKDFKAISNTTINHYQTDLKSHSAQKLKTKYLGKRSGELNKLTNLISQMDSKHRGLAGKQINLLKTQIQNDLSALKSNDNQTNDWLDVTAPGQHPPAGHLHPISQAIDEITRIFASIGFTRVRYPEVDWDYYAFESLNMPTNHPARDEWETFFIDIPENKKMGKVVLTPHTSNGQVREMERLGKPPIRMINIAKCYRRQQDVTHTAMFHQFEGLVVDKGINITNLKGTIDYFAKHFYGPNVKSRIRPFHFQFTEPSFEVDFSCTICMGKGCKFCKSGWHEVGGAGMIHPNVLKAGNIDHTKFTGFAFGWGIERTYTLKPGLKLDDIRLLYNNKLDFLKQF